MKIINLNDKFFHSPCWYYHNRELALKRFGNIIKSGKLLSPRMLGIKREHDEDKVFLSVHPDGDYSNDFEGKRIVTVFDSTTGYDMTVKGFYLILSAEVKKDYPLSPASYPHECTVVDEIEIDKYLVGIGNTGFHIPTCTVFSYYYMKYTNGEIPLTELIKVIKERRFGTNIFSAVKEAKSQIITPDPDYGTFIDYTLANKPEDLIPSEYYYDVLKILEKYGKSTEQYDMFGYSIDPKERLEIITQMQGYIRENKDIELVEIDNESIRKALTKS